MHMAGFNSVRALAFLSWSLAVQTTSLYSSQTTCPCFRPLQAFLCVCPGDLFSPHEPPGHFTCLSLCWDTSLLDLVEVIPEYQPACLGSSSLQGFIPCYSIKPGEAKVCSSEVQGNKFAEHPPHCLQHLEFCHFMVTEAVTRCTFPTAPPWWKQGPA